jgi:hypothetical protein
MIPKALLAQFQKLRYSQSWSKLKAQTRQASQLGISSTKPDLAILPKVVQTTKQ